MEKKVVKTRNYATIVYPDSAMDEWIDVLQSYKIPCLVSPLHDKDIYEKGENKGEIKKPHYHVMIMFDNTKSINQAKDIFDSIQGVGCEKIESLVGYSRYLCHLDEKNKYHYNTDDVLEFYGADYLSLINKPKDKYNIIQDIIEYCDENNIKSYSSILRYSMKERKEWFRSLCDNSSFVIREYLRCKSTFENIN